MGHLLGTPFGTPLWDPPLRPPFWDPPLGTPFGTPFGAPFWGHPLGQPFGTPLWGHPLGTALWDTLLGTALWDSPLGQSLGTALWGHPLGQPFGTPFGTPFGDPLWGPPLGHHGVAPHGGVPAVSRSGCASPCRDGASPTASVSAARRGGPGCATPHRHRTATAGLLAELRLDRLKQRGHRRVLLLHGRRAVWRREVAVAPGMSPQCHHLDAYLRVRNGDCRCAAGTARGGGQCVGGGDSGYGVVMLGTGC